MSQWTADKTQWDEQCEKEKKTYNNTVTHTGRKRKKAKKGRPIYKLSYIREKAGAIKLHWKDIC